MKNILVFLFLLSSSTAAFAETDKHAGTGTGEIYQGTPETSAPFTQAKFIPDISLIADFSAAGRNMGSDRYGRLEVPGFIPASNGEGNSAGNGFNFNYGELAVAAPVDPYFDLTAIFHLHQEGFEVEEAYVGTKALPLGINAKFGKFLSGFGRLNSQHEHFWDFVDRPVIYRGIFGDEGLNETGLQITWLAPTDTYLLFGTEILQGDNDASFGTRGFSDPDGTYRVRGIERPGLYTGFVKTSLDAGDFIFLAGASAAGGTTRINDGFDDADKGGQAEAGTTYVFGGDLTIKYLIDSYRYVSLQGEYLYRDMEGSLYQFDPASPPAIRSDLQKRQSGMYAQLIFRPFMAWRTGARYELLQQNDVKIDHAEQRSPESLAKYSFMIEYDPSEFSRFRLQFNHDASVYDGIRHISNDEVILQCNMVIGAHGAHSL